jgi:hypothetical protein
VREYSAKAFSLLMRKLKAKTFKAQCKQLLRAVASNCRANCSEAQDDVRSLAISEFEGDAETQTGIQPSKRIKDLLDGLALLFYTTSKGVKGCLHSKGGSKLSIVFDFLLPLETSVIQSITARSASKSVELGKNKTIVKRKNDQKSSEEQDKATQAINAIDIEDAWMTYSVTQVLSTCLVKLFRHLHPSNMTELWLRLLSSSEAVLSACNAACTMENISQAFSACVEGAAVFIVEALLFGLTHSKGRGLSNKEVRGSVESQLINVSLGLCEIGLCGNKGSAHTNETSWRSVRLVERLRLLLCRLWLHFPRSLILLNRVDRVLAVAIPCLWPSPAAPLLASELFPALPVDISKKHLVRPLLAAIVAMIKSPQVMKCRHTLVLVHCLCICSYLIRFFLSVYTC